MSSPSKPPAAAFDDVLAEAAWTLHTPESDDAFVDPEGNWNGIVEVSGNRLEAAGNADIARRYHAAYPTDSGGYLVWIKGTADRIEVVQYGNDAGIRSGTDLVNHHYDIAAQAARGLS